MNTDLYKPIFNIRVYGILEFEEGILVSDELHSGRSIAKFPGGGLQFGEGTTECLEREFREELSIGIQVHQHFYTTDFFQPSAFDPKQQVVSIYYLISSAESASILTSEQRFSFDPEQGVTQRFRWVRKHLIGPDEFTFPIDKKVAGMIAGSVKG